jgi:hypothetical protein
MNIAIREVTAEDSASGVQAKCLHIYEMPFRDDDGTTYKKPLPIQVTDDGFVEIPKGSPYRRVLKGNTVVIVGLIDRFEILNQSLWDEVTDLENIDLEQFIKSWKNMENKSSRSHEQFRRRYCS